MVSEILLSDAISLWVCLWLWNTDPEARITTVISIGVSMEHILFRQIHSTSSVPLVTIAFFSSHQSFYEIAEIHHWFLIALETWWRITMLLNSSLYFFISMKIWNLILLSSFYPNFQITLTCDDYVLLGPNWGLLQMWLYESLAKEFLCRCWKCFGSQCNGRCLLICCLSKSEKPNEPMVTAK